MNWLLALPCRRLIEMMTTKAEEEDHWNVSEIWNGDIIDLLLIIEGLTQVWPLSQDAALTSAKRLARLAETAAS